MTRRDKAPDALDKAKTVFKNLFGRKKKTKDQAAKPTATADASASTTKPTETTPAKPAPAAVPAAAAAAEPAKADAAPATDSAPPAPAPAPAPAPKDDMKLEQAALAEVKKATQSRFFSNYNPFRSLYGEENCDDGSRRRHKIGTDAKLHSALRKD